MSLKFVANNARVAASAFGRKNMTKFAAPALSQFSRNFSLSIASRKVLVPTSLDPAAKAILEENNYTVVQDPDTPLSDLVAAHPDAFAMIVRSEKIDETIMTNLKNLKMVVRAGAGFNTIDTKAARKLGIDVMNTPGANANAVAEEVVAMALAAFRHVVPADISTRAGLWEKKKFMGRELSNKTIGILGLGNIGQLIVQRLKGFNCKILAFDPAIAAAKAEHMGVQLSSVEEIFAQCDVVTLHIPENDVTRKMVNETLLTSMKDDAVLINCARQGVVDEDALRAVKAVKPFFYCTDVYVKDVAGDKPIKDVADIMLPHIGANTKEANNTAAKRAASQIVDYVTAGVSSFIVNRSTPPGLDPEHQKLAYYLGKIAFNWAGAQPHTIETSLYGSLKKFDKFLLPPIVLGMDRDFDPTWGYDKATAFLEEKGVSLNDREVEEAKGYGDSMTVDCLSGKDNEFTKASIRGTVGEGHLLIARIDDFDGVYFNPVGHTLMVRYPDKPGQLAQITQLVSASKVNILDIRSPQNKTGKSLAVLSLDGSLSEDVMATIKQITDADKCVQMHM